MGVWWWLWSDVEKKRVAEVLVGVVDAGDALGSLEWPTQGRWRKMFLPAEGNREEGDLISGWPVKF
jgi:hypothetical protein